MHSNTTQHKAAKQIHKIILYCYCYICLLFLFDVDCCFPFFHFFWFVLHLFFPFNINITQTGGVHVVGAALSFFFFIQFLQACGCGLFENSKKERRIAYPCNLCVAYCMRTRRKQIKLGIIKIWNWSRKIEAFAFICCVFFVFHFHFVLLKHIATDTYSTFGWSFARSQLWKVHWKVIFRTSPASVCSKNYYDIRA